MQDGINKDKLAEMRAEVEVVKNPIKMSDSRIEEVPEEFESTMRPKAVGFHQTARAGQGFNNHPDDSPSKMKRIMTMGAEGAAQDNQFQSANYDGFAACPASNDRSDVVDEAGFLYSERAISESTTSEAGNRIDPEVAKNSTDVIAPVKVTFDHIKKFVFPQGIESLEQKK